MKKIYILMIAILIGGVAAAQWQNVGGPIGCDVHCITVVGNNVFAGTRDGIYLSTNNGSSWTAVNNGLTTDNSVSSIVVNNNTIFASTWHGIFVSTNNGALWTQKDNGIMDYYAITSLVVNGNNIYGGTYNGEIYVSSNDGNNWTLLYDNLPSVNKLFFNGNDFYVGTQNGIFKSLDYGVTWNAVSIGLPSNCSVYSFAVNGGNLIAAADNFTFGIGTGAVYISNNNGASWTSVVSGLPLYFAGSSLVVLNNSIFMGTFDKGIFVSTNSGNSWTAVNNGIFNTKVKALAVYGNNIYAASNGSGIYYSNNMGNNWVFANNGLQSFLNFFTLAKSGNNIYGGTALNGIAYTNNSGNTWSLLTNGLPNNSIIHTVAVKDSFVFAGHHGGEVYESGNNGNSWTNSSNGLPANFYNYSVCISDTTIYTSLYGGGVFKKGINSQNWVCINNGLTELYILTMVVRNSTIIIGTNNGVFRSVDGGLSWQAMNNGIANYSIHSLAIIDTVVYVSSFDKIYFSAINGNSWTIMSNNLPNSTTERLLYSFDKNLLVYSDNAYVYHTSDNGITWNPLTTGLPSDADIVSVTSNDTFLLVGTNGSGVWRKALAEIVLPYTPSAISGNNQVCKGQTNISYTVPVIPGAQNYIWNHPNGFSGSSITNTIVLNVANNANPGVISVKGQNTLGTGNSATMAISVFDTPLSPSVINGVDTVHVTQSNIVFNTAPVSNATSYSWTLPNGFSGNSNTASIVLSIDTTAQSGNIYIKGQNVCGFGPQISKYVIVSMIPPPPIITQSGNTLISSSAYGNQWYNTNKSLIPGAVFQNFTPQATGDYYVNVKVGQNSNTSPVFHFILNSITESKKPVVTSLKIFPNPFSKSTTFTYTLKEKQKVNLSIYDITGRIIKQLVSEDQTQCEHALTFDAVNLQAGVYFYRLRVGDEVATGKVILAK